MEKYIAWENCFVEVLDSPLQNLVEEQRLEGFDVEGELFRGNRTQNGQEKLGLLRRWIVELLLEVVIAESIDRLECLDAKWELREEWQARHMRKWNSV